MGIVRVTVPDKPDCPSVMERKKAHRIMKDHRDCKDWFTYRARVGRPMCGRSMFLICTGCKREWDITIHDKI